jgi:hypothetical protein
MRSRQQAIFCIDWSAFYACMKKVMSTAVSSPRIAVSFKLLWKLFSCWFYYLALWHYVYLVKFVKITQNPSVMGNNLLLHALELGYLLPQPQFYINSRILFKWIERLDLSPSVWVTPDFFSPLPPKAYI